MQYEVLNPQGWALPFEKMPITAPRPTSLAGKKIILLDVGQTLTLQRVEEALHQNASDASLVYWNVTRQGDPPEELLASIDAALVGMGC